MKLKFIILVVFGAFHLNFYAQTKLIAHKSHSGNMRNFATAMTINANDLGNSNFGLIPNREIQFSKLDSLIHISDSSSIMVTRNYCTNIRSNKTKLLKIGKDTIYNQLFSKKHALDSIRFTLKKQYNFKNPIDSVVFVGYDSIKNSQIKTETTKKKNVVPFIVDVTKKPPFNLKLYGLLSILIIAVIIGFISKKRHEKLNPLESI
jgi:hypothetical protein